MKKINLILGILMIVFAGCAEKNSGEEGLEMDVLPVVPADAQAISLKGAPLYASVPDARVMEKYEEAKKTYTADPDNADNIIWYGRWAAYTGDYRQAVLIFTEGIRKFPGDARFYRHRGHRYISIREFDRAIEDFEAAAVLIEGAKDMVEADGQPNAMNIPVSTLHTNIWYHLGLAYYLKHDLENALRIYNEGVTACTNDDMLVAMTHWLYMTLRLLDKEEQAVQALDPIHEEMNVIENMVYHRLCLFYKKVLTLEELPDKEDTDIMSDAMAYGVGNWHFYNGLRNEAREIFERICDNKVWASFGFIAAEAALNREFQE
ncbi:MAG: hypothetical protein JXB23_00650 [Candidatus Aminicenantes bacterium]|nr:hypothetical protein [Candidatus Aminicenantes bacterium]